MKLTQKQALKKWDAMVKSLQKATPVDMNESAVEQSKRKERLANNPVEALYYYFPTWFPGKFAKWQKRYIKKFWDNPVISISLMVHRDGSKTTLTQGLLVIAAVNDKIGNIIYTSKTQDAAMEMIRPIRLQFEANDRLKHDFGDLRSYGAWADDKFVLKTGISFRALGKGQSPRGTKEEEKRPDTIICDDIDDDEEVLNATRLDKSWDWMMGALYGAFSIDKNKRFVVLNNRISKDCLVYRASLRADYTETINLLDKNGKPTWPERFTLSQCRYMIEQMGTRMSQREYFNNPITEGKVFKNEWIQHKKMPKLSWYQYLVAYLDPSFKNRKTADHKALILIGLKGGEYHVLKAYCANASIAEMISWHYELDQYAKAQSGSINYWMEEVFLQDLLYDDFNKAAEKYGYRIPVRGDKRKKPDKDTRISATSGDFERGSVYFNEAEKENHHMQELIEQFQLFEMGKNGIKKDGPDAFEGGRHLLQEMVFISQPPASGPRRPHSKRY
jgi:phage terminase large subunit-like protein